MIRLGENVLLIEMRINVLDWLAHKRRTQNSRPYSGATRIKTLPLCQLSLLKSIYKCKLKSVKIAYLPWGPSPCILRWDTISPSYKCFVPKKASSTVADKLTLESSAKERSFHRSPLLQYFHRTRKVTVIASNHHLALQPVVDGNTRCHLGITLVPGFGIWNKPWIMLRKTRHLRSIPRGV